MRNLEVKARIADPEAAIETAEGLAGSCRADLLQTDTYFHVSRGRLKLRECGGSAELIFYNRPDSRQASFSDYLIAEVEEPAALKEVLETALGSRAVVKKRRRLFLAGNTRIHIDEVERLGTFLELEVVLPGGNGPEGPAETIDRLLEAFGIREEDLVEVSYYDLL